jgi:hypothetical protein
VVAVVAVVAVVDVGCAVELGGGGALVDVVVLWLVVEVVLVGTGLELCELPLLL